MFADPPLKPTFNEFFDFHSCRHLIPYQTTSSALDPQAFEKNYFGVATRSGPGSGWVAGVPGITAPPWIHFSTVAMSSSDSLLCGGMGIG